MSEKLQEINTYFGNDLGNRIETGPVQFGEDWPGVFIRGDNAMGFAAALRMHIMLVEKFKSDGSPLTLSVMRSLLTLLESCNVRNLQKEDSAQEPCSAVVDSDVQT